MTKTVTKLVPEARQAQVSFTCEGKAGHFKTLTSDVQVYFRATKMVLDQEHASIEHVFIGAEALKPEEFADPNSLLRWPTAQPFETIAIMVKLKKDGPFKLTLLGPTRKVERVEI
jgi:hypothetical protein